MTQMGEAVDEQSQIIKVLDAIQQIANVTVGEFDVKKLTQQVVETLTKIINAEASSIFLLDEGKQLLIMIAGAGYSSKLLKEDSKSNLPLPATYKIGEGVTGATAKGEAIITKIGEKHLDHEEWKGKYDHVQFDSPQKRCWSYLGVPLKFKEKIVGVLKVENKKENNKYVDFTLQDQQIVVILASHIAAVIENTKLFEGQQTLTIITTLDEIAKGIQGLNEINIIDTQSEKVLQRIVEGAFKLLNAKFCHIRLIEGDKLVIKAMVPREEWQKTTVMGKGISGKVVETGDCFIIKDVEDWRNIEWKGQEYLHWEYANKYGLKACCIMPLIVRAEQGQEETLGTLNTYLDRREFSDVELEMLRIFVSQAAIAISIAQDIKERMEMQNKLAEAERMAAIGRLTSGVTHGFKNPLQIVQSATTELEKLQMPKSKDYINDINSQIKRMLEIIGIFSKFATPEIKDDIDINKLIDETIKRIGVPGSIKITKDYKSPFKVRCDAKQMQQVFENLILNAYESMGDGGNLKIITSIKDNRIKIAFDNDGEKISDGIIDKIFDPFYTTKKGKGTGLGLYELPQ
ncbi:MAG: GAF domain-containing protein [bacterium]|nr:GAF domain-containing protein [bacterium]